MRIAIVFDSAGTLVKIIRVIKDIEKNKFICNKQTVDLVDKKKGRVLVIIKDCPIEVVDKEDDNELISNFLKKVNIGISYCNPPIIKENIFKDNKTKMKELKEPLNVLKRYELETGYGSALIADTYDKKISYTIATGGCLFDGVEETIDKLKNLVDKIYIASGDRKGMVENLAKRLKIDNYIYEANQFDKRDLIKKLKEEGYFTVMVGDGANDVLAMKESDLSIATLQNGSVSPKVLEIADKKIYHIKEIIDIIKEIKNK
ncbi:HAD-IC family P-type ATPase [Methanocaldococcus indicus]|uniref:HAD-IC family P-type ATPase n=1 Tax=Methanocaldococcus indicus TaxID=213231 RepID=UPI003C6D5439